MIRRLLDFVLILIFVWACMLLGLWVIDSIIVPLRLPIGGSLHGVINAVVRAGLSLGLVIFWLWLWREIIKRTFWRAIKKR